MSGVLHVPVKRVNVGQRFDQYFIIYDEAKCIEIMVAQGNSVEDAEEYFAVNMVGASVGERMPAFRLDLR